MDSCLRRNDEVEDILIIEAGIWADNPQSGESSTCLQSKNFGPNFETGISLRHEYARLSSTYQYCKERHLPDNRPVFFCQTTKNLIFCLDFCISMLRKLLKL
ncbi:hypothetical protein [Undibacterium pigrum]|uniref:hypothetical protein n=1 Tax=Undibacterium pigrum TaxID=401470 RepID=UPI001472E8C3|nr:hypothetical protein [Undibacterium pigrum]